MKPDSEDRQDDPTADLEPGAARFWGQVSQARPGRNQTDAEATAGEETPLGKESPVRGRPAGNDGSAADMPGEEAGNAGSDGEPEQHGTQGHGSHSGHGEECLDWCPVCRSAELFRNRITPELREQVEAVQREALNVFNAFLTAYSERTAGGNEPGAGSREGDRSTAPPPEPDESGPGPGPTDIPLD